jgi:translation initiation factor 6
MTVIVTSFHGNPNVGLYAYYWRAAAQRVCLLGARLSDTVEQEMAQQLGGELHHLSVAGTPMPGVFLAGNRHALLVPGIVFDHEIAALQRLGLPVRVFDTKLTCLGNNLLVNDHGCLAHPEFSDDEIEELTKLLQVPVKRMSIAGIDTPGACVVLNGQRGIIHRDAAEFEIAMVKSTLKLHSLEPASVNLGSPYLKAGIIAGAEGFVIGEQSGGPEIVHVEQSLGYLPGE